MTTFLLPVANHLWQSTVFTIVAAVLVLMLRKNRAGIRYWIWCIASMKFILPFSLLMALGSQFSRPVTSSVPSAPSVSALVIQQVSQPFTAPPTAPVPAASAQGVGVPVPLLLAIVLLIWLAGCAFLTIRWSMKWRSVQAVVRHSPMLTVGREFETLRRLERRLGTRKSISMASSTSAIEPCVFGIFRSVLIWPNELSGRLRDGELESILMHELSHARRRDNLAAALHMIVETVFWFHPLVWWLGVRLVDEREKACDQDVLEQGGASVVYAEGILKVCEFCLHSPMPCAAGVTGSGLKRRIEEITSHRATLKLSPVRIVLLTAAALAAVAGPIAIGAGHTKAQTPSANSFDALTFEAASIKPGNPALANGPNVPNGDGAGAFPACAGGSVQVDPQRFSATSTTVYTLITLAYGIRYSCFIVNASDLLSGGPGWVISDRFDVQAAIPAGTSSYTLQQLRDGAAPPLQAMLRNLLKDRFKLAVHQGMKDMRVYTLTSLPGAVKLSPALEDRPKFIGLGIEPDENKEFIVHIRGNKASVTDFTHAIEPVTHTPVPDRTGIKGEYSFDIKFAVIEPFSGALAGLVGADSPTIFNALQRELGLKLEAGRGPVDSWVIDHAEKPTAN